MLATRSRRRAVIRFAQDEHEGRRHVLDVSYGRARLEILFLIKRRALEPIGLEKSEVRRVPPVGPARDVALSHRCGEAGCLSHHPIGQQSTAASAGHAHFLFIDIAAPDQFIHAGHQIFVIVARIMILNDVAKILAVGCAAPRIRIKHDVSFRGHPLKFVLENVAVGRMGSAVDVKDERILFPGTKIRRLLHPRLDRFAIEALVRNFFRLGQIELGEKFLVKMCQLLRLTAARIECEEIADARRR